MVDSYYLGVAEQYSAQPLHYECIQPECKPPIELYIPCTPKISIVIVVSNAEIFMCANSWSGNYQQSCGIVRIHPTRVYRLSLNVQNVPSQNPIRVERLWPGHVYVASTSVCYLWWLDISRSCKKRLGEWGTNFCSSCKPHGWSNRCGMESYPLRMSWLQQTFHSQYSLLLCKQWVWPCSLCMEWLLWFPLWMEDTMEM